MKTPWSDLLKYGVAVPTIVVGCVAGLIILSLVGIAILIAKLLVFIK